MNDWSRLKRFLDTDPSDVGSAETFEFLDVYAELTLANGHPDTPVASGRTSPGLSPVCRTGRPPPRRRLNELSRALAKVER